MRRRLGLAAALALVALLALPLSGAFAAGRPNSPTARIVYVSACLNPTSDLCTQSGLGGTFLVMTLNSDNTGTAFGAEVSHTVGSVNGPGSGGATPIHGAITWSQGTDTTGATQVGTDPNGNYYIVTLPNSDVFAFPATQGHYGTHSAPVVFQMATVTP